MATPLVACPTCSRHVRTTETACPFCAAALPRTHVARKSAPRRLDRAAAFFFGASVTLGACTGEVTDEKGASGMHDGGPEDDGSVSAHYGLPPPVDAGTDDDGGELAMYGG